jgi:HSP90 family molecular chaperone
MPTSKGLDPIIEKSYIDPVKNWRKIKDKNKKYKSILSEFDDCIQESLAETNVNIIKKICQLLDIQTHIVLDDPTTLTSTERLVSLCNREKATIYLAGTSGRNYMDLSLFNKQNIDVRFQDEDSMIKKPILEVLNETCV